MTNSASEGTPRKRRVTKDREVSQLVRREKQQALAASFGLKALLSAETDHPALYDEAMRVVSDVLAADLCGYFEINADGKGVLLVSGVGWADGLVGSHVEALDGETHTAVTIRSLEPMAFASLSDHGAVPFSDGRMLQRHGVVSGVSVMAHASDGLQGVLVAYSARPRGFNGDDRNFLQTIANVLAGLRKRRLGAAALQQSELKLRQAQKMDAVGRLAGGVAHDFNNLLTLIHSYSEMVMAELDGEGYEAIRADVEEIRKASQKAAALTRQLLAFSRRQVLQPRELNLNDVIDALQKMLRRVIGEDVQLDVDLHGELPPVFADPGQIEQVLLSLVLNSRDAMPAGGRLAISSASVQVEGGQRGRWSDAAPGEYAEVTVSDSGVGIPSNILPHIFEPFFSTKERSSHAGLGLSTVYGIVSQSGGFLSVESAEGMGAVLRILLPSHTPPLGKEAIAESSRVHSQQGGKTILLVEDEPGVRNVARRVLEGSGFSILEAASGDEALDIFAANAGRVDLVVTDIVMPGMNGRTFVRKLEEQKGAVMPRVLYMSGYSEDDIVRQDLLVADVAFLEKPFSMQSLLSAVQKSLQ